MTRLHDRTRLAAVCGVVLALLAVAGGCRSMGPLPVMAADHIAVAANDEPAFAVGLVPTMAPPVRVGMTLGFRLSSSAAGYGHLYLLNSSGDVLRLAENLSLAADAQTDFPRPGDGVQIQATPPAGVERLILLVTRQPFAGFANNQGQLATNPMLLAMTAEDFLNEFNDATDSLPANAWAVVEEQVQVIE